MANTRFPFRGIIDGMVNGNVHGFIPFGLVVAGRPSRFGWLGSLIRIQSDRHKTASNRFEFKVRCVIGRLIRGAAVPFPAKSLLEYKFWPHGARVANVFGDRKPVCSCVEMENYSAGPDTRRGRGAGRTTKLDMRKLSQCKKISRITSLASLI
jgi:hypothetical protein